MKKVRISTMVLALGLMVLASCNKDKHNNNEAVLSACMEQHGFPNRTIINPETGQIKWLNDDKIVIVNGENVSAQFAIQTGAGEACATFHTTEGFEMTGPFVAAYPQNATINGTTVTFDLQPTQTLTQTGTFADGANPMVAYSSDENLLFKNLCGGLNIRLLGNNVHVSGIRITGGQGEKLNGAFETDCTAAEPVLVATQGNAGTNAVTLNCDVTLTSTTTAQEFFIILPVGALGQGFTMEVLDGENVIAEKTLETNMAQIERNHVKCFNPLLIGETPTPIELPDVTTAQITNITTTTAIGGGEIISNGGNAIIECGLCWSTDQEPTIAGDHIASDVTMGGFSAQMTGLSPNTTYYVRAYAINGAGTGYGEVLTFTTGSIITVPTVTTAEVTGITSTTATVGGTITDAGNGTIEESGICYKIGNDDWTCMAVAATNNIFSVVLEGLTPNTTYTIHAYATNEEGTSYGDDVTFTTLTGVPEIPEGAINGLFTINANGDQVYFSQGNLQYQASTNIWRFAENQWDFVGGAETQYNYHIGEECGTVYENGVKCDNTLISSTYSGWIDLFGWGTSGYNHGAVCYQPWSISENGEDYYAYGNSEYNLYDQNGQADWGYNAISNGGNLENSGWRTLTQPEWNYVLNTRTTTSGMRWAHAYVNDVEGLIILPDNWSNAIYTLNHTNIGLIWGQDGITATDWTDILEVNGAVFLPGAYLRQSLNQFVWWGNDMYGNYWSSTSNGSSASFVNFTFGGDIYMFSSPRHAGLSVRLVRNAE